MSALRQIPLDQIKSSVSNPRERLTEIEELAASIKRSGLLQPIVVQVVPGQRHVTVVDGHRRVAAMRHLGWTAAPGLLRHDMLPDEELVAMLAANGQRKDLDPIETAKALRRLVDEAGMTIEEVAQHVGRTRQWVYGRLDLLKLSPDKQEGLRSGLYTMNEAGSVLRAQREAQRRVEKPAARPVGRPPGAKTKPYFGDTHPLANLARRLCRERGHGKGHIKIAGIACGPCWEETIRGDEATKAGDLVGRAMQG